MLALILIPFAVIAILLCRGALACTSVYVGKDVSADGHAMFGRCADTHPTVVPCSVQISERVEGVPGRVLTGNNGFMWALPDTTYRYIGLPRPACAEKGVHWESATTNEYGLAVSATTTGYACREALAADPYAEGGITEDNIAGLLAACCRTAQEAMAYLAKVIDTVGSGESNMVMVADPNEAWYMEIYTGHQYAALRLPDDRAAAYGNEFMLDGIDPDTPDTLVSDGLFSLPKTAGFAYFNEDGSLNLFDTYAGKGRIADYANLRTWRGHQLFAPSKFPEYEPKRKYPFLFEPDAPLTLDDLKRFYRDRYEGTPFENDPEGKTRVVATETAAHIHLFVIHDELPAERAVEEWLCLSNASYAPFVPLSNAITSVSDAYGYVLPAFELDDASAYMRFKKLNALAAQDRRMYGAGIAECWKAREDEWREDFSAALKTASGDALTSVSQAAQTGAYEDAGRLFDELLWYVMLNTDSMRYGFSYTTLEITTPAYDVPFEPTMDAAAYAARREWTVTQDDASFTFRKGERRLEITPKDEKRTSKGRIVEDGQERETEAAARGGRLYMPLSRLTVFDR